MGFTIPIHVGGLATGAITSRAGVARRKKTGIPAAIANETHISVRLQEVGKFDF